MNRKKPFSSERVSELLDEAIHVSRTLVYELSPPVLHDSNLPEALQWLANWFAENHQYYVELKMARDFPTLAEESKRFVLDVVRELLFNSVKHSGVHKATLRLHSLGRNRLQVEVVDQGRGFDPAGIEEGNDGEGFGLFSIRERLVALGGALEIESAPGKGARFAIRLPFFSGSNKSTPAAQAVSHINPETLRPQRTSNHIFSTRLLAFANAAIELADAEITHLDGCNACQKHLRIALRLVRDKVVPAPTRVQSQAVPLKRGIEVFSATRNLLQERREHLDRFRDLHRQAVKTEAFIRLLYRSITSPS
jgi:hypothetical protein